MKGSSDGHLKFDGQRWEKGKIKGKGALSLETVYPSLAQTSAANEIIISFSRSQLISLKAFMSTEHKTSETNDITSSTASQAQVSTLIFTQRRY